MVKDKYQREIQTAVNQSLLKEFGASLAGPIYIQDPKQLALLADFYRRREQLGIKTINLYSDTAKYLSEFLGVPLGKLKGVNIYEGQPRQTQQQNQQIDINQLLLAALTQSANQSDGAVEGADLEKLVASLSGGNVSPVHTYTSSPTSKSKAYQTTESVAKLFHGALEKVSGYATDETKQRLALGLEGARELMTYTELARLRQEKNPPKGLFSEWKQRRQGRELERNVGGIASGLEKHFDETVSAAQEAAKKYATPAAVAAVVLGILGIFAIVFSGSITGYSVFGNNSAYLSYSGLTALFLAFLAVVFGLFISIKNKKTKIKPRKKIKRHINRKIKKRKH